MGRSPIDAHHLPPWRYRTPHAIALQDLCQWRLKPEESLHCVGRAGRARGSAGRPIHRADDAVPMVRLNGNRQRGGVGLIHRAPQLDRDGDEPRQKENKVLRAHSLRRATHIGSRLPGYLARKARENRPRRSGRFPAPLFVRPIRANHRWPTAGGCRERSVKPPSGQGMTTYQQFCRNLSSSIAPTC
jgi:hypothetical protein